MIKYDNILYVGSMKPLICRDGNEKYANSMDLKFVGYSQFINSINNNWNYDKGKAIIFDIAVGWTTLDEISEIEDYLKYLRHQDCKVFFRLVDQFKHQESSDVYTIMKGLSNVYNIPIIGTYQVDYYGLKVCGVIPYPYLMEEERSNKDIYDREDSIILTGADIPDIYPLRCSLYNLSSEYIESINHPGYSGKGWCNGLIGDKYLDKLSKYQFMACTTCIEGYELLKYIECAEAGCIPIGEVPPSLKGTEAEKYIIEIPKNLLNSVEEFNNWFLEMQDRTILKEFSNGYRSAIKDLNDKESLKTLLLSIVNS